MKYIVCIFTVLFSTEIVGQYNVLRWYQGKSAAVSITFDGDFDIQYKYALPTLKKSELKGTFFVSAQNINFKKLKKLLKYEHELGSRTYSAKDLSTINPEEIVQEIEKNKTEINQVFPDVAFDVLAYPLGMGAKVGSENDSIRAVISEYFISARGEGRAGGYLGEFEEFDAHDEYLKEQYDDYFYQIGSFTILGDLKLGKFKTIISDVIDEYGWFVPRYCNIESGEALSVSEEAFKEHMVYLSENEENLWIAPFGDVSKYLKERKNAVLEEVSQNETEWRLELKDSLPDDVYNHPLTLQLRIPNGMRVKEMSQGDRKLKEGVDYLLGYKVLQFNAIPDAGEIVIYKLPPLEEDF